MPTRSYLSQSELPVTIGLGESDSVGRVTVHWPDGTTQELPEVPIDTVVAVNQPAT
jgi:hypothetical protein